LTNPEEKKIFSPQNGKLNLYFVAILGSKKLLKHLILKNNFLIGRRCGGRLINVGSQRCMGAFPLPHGRNKEL